MMQWETYAKARTIVQAEAESCPVVVEVRCQSCGDGPVLGRVHRHDRYGPVYVARSGAWVSRHNVLREHEAAAKAAGQRITAASGMCIVLLNLPDLAHMGADRIPRILDGPAAQCDRHGRAEIERPALVAAADRYSGRRPEIVTIH